jgi:hypothetical protein
MKNKRKPIFHSLSNNNKLKNIFYPIDFITPSLDNNYNRFHHGLLLGKNIDNLTFSEILQMKMGTVLFVE